jgi:hypothetical protein
MIAWLKARAKVPANIEADKEVDRLTVVAIRKYLRESQKGDGVGGDT